MLIVCFHAILSHLLPLDYPTQKRKKPCQEPATIGGALHSLLGFLFAVSSRNALHLKNIKMAVRNVAVKTMKMCRVEKLSGKNRNLANTLYIGSKASTKCFCSALFSSAVRPTEFPNIRNLPPSSHLCIFPICFILTVSFYIYYRNSLTLNKYQNFSISSASRISR